jgi:hypothetical protein
VEICSPIIWAIYAIGKKLPKVKIRPKVKKFAPKNRQKFAQK